MSSKKKCVSAALSEDIMFFAAQYEFFFPSYGRIGQQNSENEGFKFSQVFNFMIVFSYRTGNCSFGR